MEHYLTINQLKQNKAREYKLINPSDKINHLDFLILMSNDNIFIIYNKVKEKCIYTENSEIRTITV